MKKIVLSILGLVGCGICNLRLPTMEELDSRQHSMIIIAANMATENLDVLKTTQNKRLYAGINRK